MRLLETSPTEVVWLATNGDGPRYYEGGSAAAILGKRTHKQILSEALRTVGVTLPGFEGSMSFGVDGELVIEKGRKATFDGVLVSATLDGEIDQSVCVEVKPGNEVRGRHLLQLMLNCMVLSSELGGISVEGLLYLYGAERVIPLPNGGIDGWEAGARACVLASQIISGQERIDLVSKVKKGKRESGQWGMRMFETEVGWIGDTVDQGQMVGDRNEFDRIIHNDLLPILKGLVTGY